MFLKKVDFLQEILYGARSARANKKSCRHRRRISKQDCASIFPEMAKWPLKSAQDERGGCCAFLVTELSVISKQDLKQEARIIRGLPIHMTLAMQLCLRHAITYALLNQGPFPAFNGGTPSQPPTSKRVSKPSSPNRKVHLSNLSPRHPIMDNSIGLQSQ